VARTEDYFGRVVLSKKQATGRTEDAKGSTSLLRGCLTQVFCGSIRSGTAVLEHGRSRPIVAVGGFS
jgi:hypothetical protein